MNGAIEQRLDAALNQEVSHIHINDPGFRDNYDIQLTIPGFAGVMDTLSNVSGIEAVVQRTILTAMANTATKSTGVQLVGIDPAMEQEVFTLHKTTMPGTGDFFESESRRNLAYIGQDLAKHLNIIRYRIEEPDLDSLSQMGVPQEVLDKLVPFIGYRFKSEKEFKKEMKRILTLKEQHAYATQIKELAWSFRARSKMTLTFLDKDQMQTGAVFRIAGIYDVKNNMYEMSQVFVRQSDLSRLTGLAENQFHQLILKVEELDNAEEISKSLSQALPDLEVMSWKKIRPDLAMMTGMVQKFYGVFMGIILAALAFGIVNTMLMVVLERTKELGMLTAIGMNKKRVFSMIMLESVFLSLVGGVVGMVVSRILIAFTATNGINFQGYEEGFEAMGYSAHVYPVITPTFFITVTVLIIITGILSSIYPALKALKLDPADALRTE
jgi:ABC-type lipoprotein release transport system permease subunit